MVNTADAENAFKYKYQPAVQYIPRILFLNVNECDLDEGICAEGSECKNTQGNFECERRCESGFHASADGECIDLDECSLGLDNCEASTECYNIEGSFECIESCADGFYHNTESICEDINECQLDDPCNQPMFCENLLGSFKCLCPAGFPIANDTCQGISMDPLNPLKSMEYSSEPEEGNCPSGFMWDSGQSVCADLDECAFDAPCQFDCTNTAGTYECSCPDGYALNDQGQCIDINECDAESACDEGEVCFNQLGEYSCIRNPCPRNYRLDHLKAQCLPRCQNCSDVPINLHMLAVPKGLGADTPLVRLSAHDKAGRVLRNTNFHIMADKMEGTRGLVPHTNGPYHSPLPFYLKTKKGRATVHNQLKLLAGSLHKIPIRSSSMNKEGEIPGIKTPAEQLKVVEGKEQRLECIVTGIPLPKVEWRRNGDPMDDGRDHHTSTAGNSHFLHIHNTNISDAGRYSCVATNRAGETRQNIQLNVLVPPTIGDGERIMKVAEGSQLALDCLAKGHPTPEIVWRKNGATITPTLKTRLLLENLTSGENGRYTCEATNEAGTAVADFVVEVLIKPRMKDHSAELRVVEGERAKLDCKADGYPEPTIKWMRGGRPITDMTNFILSPRGETLMILRTKRSDGGAYSCNVKNSAGEIEAPFTVIVLTAPHIEQTIDQNPRVINNNSIVLDCPILGHPKPEVVCPSKVWAEGQRIFEVVEGDSVTISCPVEAVPLPEIEWLRGVNPIYSSDNVRVSEESKKVTIVKTTLHDGGKYTCKATNIAGSTDIDLILKVLVPPTIDKSNLISNPLAIFGREIFLECPASGIPQPTILWTRDGVVIDVENSDEGKYSLHQSNQSFGINKIEASDQGKYTCEVQNKGGKTSEQFMVEVLEPPQMETTEPQKLTKREGDLLTLVCPVKNEDVEVDSELRITNEGRRLQLTSSSISDAGHYKCVASNRAGQSHVKFHVEILCTHMASEFCRQLEHRHMIEYKKDYDRRRHIYESQATRRRETHFGRQTSTNTDPDDPSTVLKKVHKRTTATPRTFMTPQPRKSFENFPVQPTYADFSVEFDPLIPTLQPPISPTGLVYPVNGHRIYDYLTLNSSPVVPNRRYRVYSAPSGLVHRDVAETRLMKPLGNRYFSTEVQYSGPGQGFVGTLKARKHVNNLRANLKTLLKKRRRRHHFAMDDLYSSFFVSSNTSVIRA
uniref:Uncharacterized protein n=1 Tax=Ditylenchus dipsaci TaxID=166011 RepID=A0A915CWE3_9BILA